MPVLGAVQDNSLFKVTFRQRLFGQRILNILWYQTDIVVPGVDAWDACMALAEELNLPATGIATQLRDLQDTSVLWDSIRVQYYGVDSAPRPYYELAVDAAGTITGGTPTSNVAASIHKRALYPLGEPEKGNGRLQLAGVPAASMAQGMLTEAYADLFANVCQDMADPIIIIDGDLQVGPVLVTQTPANFEAHDIYQCAVKPEVRDMRRRTVGLGE